MDSYHSAAVDVGTPSPEFRGWASTDVRYHGFEGLTTERGHSVISPEFTCLGNRWCLHVYPGGDRGSDEGMITAFLFNMSDESINIQVSLRIRDYQGRGVGRRSPSAAHTFAPKGVHRSGQGGNFVDRSTILDSLVNGALVIEVQMQLAQPTKLSPFIPENPSACKVFQSMFMDEETADVLFEVQQQKGESHATKKTKIAPATFHAHRIILKKCATTLSDLCGPGDKSTPIPITDVSPDMFRHLLNYVYGGKVADGELKENAKDIIDAADKYGISNLKLEAEAYFVQSTTFTIENMMENLLYADSKNCALLKEAIMDFIVENKVEVMKKISFNDAPSTMITDVLAAMARGEKENGNNANSEDQFSTMRISELRRRVHEKGLDVDGSRETLVAALEENN